MANVITCFRVVFSMALLSCPTFSTPFYILYLASGFTDMIDGPVARKTRTVSEFGAGLDSAADLVFVVACLYKLLPALNIELWIYVFIGVIALIKAVNIVSGAIMRKKLVTVHSTMNRITGGALFLLPLTVYFIDFRFGAAVVCAIALFAAVEEGHIIRMRKDVAKIHLLMDIAHFD